MNRGKSCERRQCFHHDMIGYDWLCSAVIGSCDKSPKQFNGVIRKTNKKVSKQLTHLGYVFTSTFSFLNNFYFRPLKMETFENAADPVLA